MTSFESNSFQAGGKSKTIIDKSSEEDLTEHWNENSSEKC